MSYTEYKQKILSFYRHHKRMPGYMEIMGLTGFKSKNAVYKLINKLVDDGVVRKDANGRISPERVGGEVGVLGVVEAGIPSPAEEQTLDTLTLDELLVPEDKEMFLLQVKGESMIEAHIAQGDLVLVERSETAKEGEIVIAEADGEWTMKYYRKKQGRAYLEPANKKFKPIYPEDTLRIAGIVRAVIRKYKK